MNRRDIALSLSGGGFRAAYFHLGVLKKLDELRLLGRVGIISSVSGGSILAGLYATSLLHDESFDEFLERAQQFLNRRLPLDWPAMVRDILPWSRSSKGLERNYRRAFRDRSDRPILLSDLEGLAPLFVINSTAVHSGSGWRFLSGGAADHWDLGFTHGKAFETRFYRSRCDVPLGVAVAASSAFPTFSAVTIRSRTIHYTGEHAPVDTDAADVVPQLSSELPDPLALSDGGVLDNLGSTSILAGMSPPESPESFYLIASDAGSAIDRLRSPPKGKFRKLHYLMRQFEMRGNHNNDMTSFLVLAHHRSYIRSKGMAIFRIDRAVPHASETLEQVGELARIKTRLKRLSEKQYMALMDHAANLLWTRLMEYTDLLPPELEMPKAEKRARTDLPLVD